MSPEKRRATRDLTLGFLTLGAQAAPLDVLAAAAHAGFGAAGLRVSGRNPGDAWVAVGDEVLREAARLGVRVSSISGYYMSANAQLDHLLANVRAAKLVGAPLIAQGCFDADLSRAASMLRDYAAAAQEAGVRIALEFMPMSTLRSIGEALDVIERSGARNVGLLVDALHLARSGAGAAEVRTLDASKIYLTQLCDAPAQRAASVTLFDEAMSGRMYLGDGGLDLAGLVDALPANAEIELETPVVADAGLPPGERAQRAAQKAAAFFSAAAR